MRVELKASCCTELTIRGLLFIFLFFIFPPSLFNSCLLQTPALCNYANLFCFRGCGTLQFLENLGLRPFLLLRFLRLRQLMLGSRGRSLFCLICCDIWSNAISPFFLVIRHSGPWLEECPVQISKWNLKILWSVILGISFATILNRWWLSHLHLYSTYGHNELVMNFEVESCIELSLCTARTVAFVWFV